ncbi:unnamed protein product, partial [Thlaspi arvense]
MARRVNPEEIGVNFLHKFFCFPFYPFSTTEIDIDISPSSIAPTQRHDEFRGFASPSPCCILFKLSQVKVDSARHHWFMGGHRRHVNSKPAREIFLTSSSLSFSTLSSTRASWDDAVELNTKESTTSSETSGVTHVRLQPAPSPPSRLPVQLMNKGIVGPHQDPDRIPASVFGKTGDLNWSEVSNESLFSLRLSNYQAFRQSNINPEEVLMSGENIASSPTLLVKPDQDAQEKRSEVKETKSGVTSVEANGHQEKSSLATNQVVSWSSNPSSFYQLYQAPPTNVQSLSIPVAEKKSKKRSKTIRKSKTTKKKEKKTKKKKKKKKKKNKCCIWSWLVSSFSKWECNLCCYKWRKRGCCCREPKAMVL